MRALVMAVAAAALSVPASAATQNVGTTDQTYGEPRENDDKDFPWGLLGLLGLAGLLGMKKREPDIHVDARRDPRT